MSFLNALGAIGSGVSAGIQDLERMDEAKFRKEQQKRIKAEQDAEDEDTKALAGIDPKLSGTDLYKARADVLSRSKSKTNQKLGAEYTDMSRRMGREDLADKQQQYLHTMLQARRLASTNPTAAAAAAAKAYELVNDGHKAIIDPQAGTIGVAGPDAKWVMQPKAITPQGVTALINEGLEFASPDMMRFFADQRDKSEGRAIQREGNVIHGRQVDNQNAYQTGMLGIYGDRNKLDRDEFAARKAGGMYTKDQPKPTLIGLNDPGSAVLGLTAGGLKEYAVPPGYTGLFPKVTGSKPRDEINKVWLDTESKLIQNGEKPDAIRQQQSAFYARRGFAPPDAEDVLMKGVGPKGKPLTEDDVKEFNRRYPKSAVKMEELPWYKK